MAYVVAVHGSAEELWSAPMILGPFDTGLLAADFAARLPKQYRWNTLYLNSADSNVARRLLEPASAASDEDDEYDGVAVLLAGSAVRAQQIKHEQAGRLPDIAAAHVWTPAMSGKDGLRIDRIYLAQGGGLNLHSEPGRRALSTALRCARKTPNWDRQVWELTTEGEVRPFDIRRDDPPSGDGEIAEES